MTVARLFHFLACIALILAFGMGSLAHATEPVGCVDVTQSATAAHNDGDADQVQGDADKAYPHHHGGCHGHHIAASVEGVTIAPSLADRSLDAAWVTSLRAPAPPHADLRPPIA